MRFPEFPGAKSETDVGYRGIKSRFPHRVLVPHEAPLDVVLTDSAVNRKLMLDAVKPGVVP